MSDYRPARIVRCSGGSAIWMHETTQSRAFASRAAARADPHRGARRRWPCDRSEQALRRLGGHDPSRPSPPEAGGSGRPHLRRCDLESPTPSSPAWTRRSCTTSARRMRSPARRSGFVGDGDVIILDAGTTTGRLAWYLRERSDLTVITNAVNVLQTLCLAGGPEVVVLGGEPAPHQPGAAGRARRIQPPAAARRHACSSARRGCRRPGESRVRRWARATSKS